MEEDFAAFLAYLAIGVASATLGVVLAYLLTGA